MRFGLAEGMARTVNCQPQCRIEYYGLLVPYLSQWLLRCRDEVKLDGEAVGLGPRTRYAKPFPLHLPLPSLLEIRLRDEQQPRVETSQILSSICFKNFKTSQRQQHDT